MAADIRATVTVLLDTAGITASAEEFDKFTDSYPVLRAQADGLYLPHLDTEEPALSFDPVVE
ncbi:hypothetical protein MOQ72_00570 [Saccharopolyspora sp. K220]|uniref:hypothetical protein n=1 Tax=Saccharopolyspora soli TaxID=2926618 RepID=UPI001F5A9DB1|nr:hypothetical protein [Saccharopolyspora soli]MCI2415903.1 hypothetical protein [Saccharopolyspora soli]